MREITTAFGSLRVVQRDPRHVHGDGDDGTMTRAGKWAAACGGINLRDPVRSIRRHRQARTRMVVLIVSLSIVGWLAARYLWRML